MKKIYIVEINEEHALNDKELNIVSWLNEKGGGVFKTLHSAFNGLIDWFNYAYSRGVLDDLKTSKNTITMDIVEFIVPNNFNVASLFEEADDYLYDTNYQHEVINCLYLCGNY